MNVRMKGFDKFIREIRKCQNREQERDRVNGEIANISANFAKKHKIDGYQMRKYVWKLMYMYMMGYDVTVGHMEAVELVAHQNYSEKCAGYLACSFLLNEDHEVLRLIIQSMKKDLHKSQNPLVQALALHCIANVGGKEFALSLLQDVTRLLFNDRTPPYVRKKSALALLRLLRKYPDMIPSDPEDPFPKKVLHLLKSRDIGVLLCSTSLLNALVSYDPQGYENGVRDVASLLMKLLRPAPRSVYKYFFTICPWLQVKLLRFLQFYPPPKDKQLLLEIRRILTQILIHTKLTNVKNKNNADLGIVFECIRLIIHYSRHGVRDLLPKAVAALMIHVKNVEANYKYLALDALAQIASFPETLPLLRNYLAAFRKSLYSDDTSIRHRAVDLMYNMGEKSNVKQIVGALLEFMPKADHHIREQLVLKVAILAEKFAGDQHRWYVDVILRLIKLSGAFISDGIWYRFVQYVTNRADLHAYAALSCYKLMELSWINQNCVKVAAYILGEFGHKIDDSNITGSNIIDVIVKQLPSVDAPTQSLILTALAKLSNAFPKSASTITEVMARFRTSGNIELQQRANEYHVMGTQHTDIMSSVFTHMPKYDSERLSALESKVEEVQRGSTTDRDPLKDSRTGRSRAESDVGSDSESDSGSDSESSDSVSSGDDSDEKQPLGGDSDDDIFGALSSDSKSSKPKPSPSSSRPMPPLQLDPPQPSASREILGAKRGLLYRSQGFEIGVQIQRSQGSVTFEFFVGNKTGRTLKNVALKAVCDSKTLTVSSPEDKEPTWPTVASGKQVRGTLKFTVVRPFKVPPQLFLACGKQRLKFVLPLQVMDFCAPRDVPSDKYMAGFQRTGNEMKSMLQLPEEVSQDDLETVFSGKLGSAVIHNVAPKGFVTAAMFRTGKVSMVVLTRVQTKGDLLHIVVRSGHESLSQAVLVAVSSILRAKPANK